MKTKTGIIIAIILLLIGLGSGLWIGHSIWKPKPFPIGLPKYFPVIVKVPHYIDNSKPYDTVIPPHITYQYMSYDDSMKLVGLRDSLLTLVSVGPHHDTVRIKSKYLTAFPTNPKLIKMDLQLDSIWLTVLNIEAQLSTKQYPLNLFNYRYRFDGTTMSVEPHATSFGVPKKHKWEVSLNGYVGMELLKLPSIEPMASGEVEINYKRWLFRAEPTLTLVTHPEFGIEGKVGYRIWSTEK